MARKKSPASKAQIQWPVCRAPELPGQDPDRFSEVLRILNEGFVPESAYEQMLVGDMAYVVVRIEHLRAMAAGYHALIVTRSYSDICSKEKMRSEEAFSDFPSDFSELEAAQIHNTRFRDFIPSAGMDFFDFRGFAMMMGNRSESDLKMLGHFHSLEQSLLRERDRLVNQLERRRRQAMLDALAQAESSAKLAAGTRGEQ